MNDIYIHGYCSYEIEGIISFLKEKGKNAFPLQEKQSINSNDTLIIALDVIPLLGWGKYLSTLNELSSKYFCKIIAIVPPCLVELKLKINRVLFIALSSLYENIDVLQLDLDLELLEENKRTRVSISTYNMISLLTLFIPSFDINRCAKKLGLSKKTVYYHRTSICKIIGVSHISIIQVCFAGVIENIVNFIDISK